MRARPLLILTIVAAWTAVPNVLYAQTQVGAAFTYQGWLKDGNAPANGLYDFEFILWDDSLAGSMVGSSSVITGVQVTDGLFTVLVNTGDEFGPDAFNGAARWLEVWVNGALLTPRQPITPTPYALYAVDSPGGGAGNSLDAADGDPNDAVFVDVEGKVGIGTTSPERLLHLRGSNAVLRVDRSADSPGLQLVRTANGDLSTIWKTFSVSVKGDGVNSGTFVIGDKGAQTSGASDPRLVIDNVGKVGIGTDVPSEMLTVAGTVESTTGGFRLPDGTIIDEASDLGGGGGNTLDAAYDQGGAGAGRMITADAGAVEIQGAGGLTVAGTIQAGSSITIDGTNDQVSSTGDLELRVDSSRRVLRLEPGRTVAWLDQGPNIIAGWSGNNVSPDVTGATIAGGGGEQEAWASWPNRVTADFGTVGGGKDNEAGDHATVSGGESNSAPDQYATVGGGHSNTASTSSVVSGGEHNVATSSSAVGGGAGNVAEGLASVVGGGVSNTASGVFCVVPGGEQNEAHGTYSFAAGLRAKANHSGAFVWGDSTSADFASTGLNQFLIRAGGGVGIGTNDPAGYALNVAGSVNATDLLINGVSVGGGAGGIGGGGTTNYLPKFTGPTVIGDSAISEIDGDVGIGTTSPDSALEVAGDGTNRSTITAINEGAHTFVRAITATNNPSTRAIFDGRRSRGTIASPQDVLAGDQIASLLANEYVNGAYRTGASIDMWAGSSPAGGSYPTYMTFSTTDENQTARVERMRIDQNGNVGIGTADPNKPLHVVGGARVDGAIESTSGGFKLPDGTILDEASDVGASLWTGDGSGIHYSAGNVGIGTSASDADLTVKSLARVASTWIAPPYNTITGIEMESTFLGGVVTLRNPAENVTLELRGGQYDAGNVILYNSVGVQTVEIDADEADGAAIRLKNSADSETVVIDSDEAGVAEVHLKNAIGNTVIELDGLEGGAALIRLSKPDGTPAITLDASDGTGDGRIITDVLEITGGSDLSENFDVAATADGDARSSVTPEPGMVVSIDPANPGKLAVAWEAYDKRVAGIISGGGGVRTGLVMGQEGTIADGQYAVALTGRVWCYVDAGFGAIEPGDQLTTSNTPGHAMRASDHDRARGAVIGKAMTGLESGKGMVLVLVQPQ